ncbi:hypothetical protein J6590_025684 [Homalodisca vitripennis]|nr:hypothetical protein J6590_025684 [Homalodisca vitripennis]
MMTNVGKQFLERLAVAVRYEPVMNWDAPWTMTVFIMIVVMHKISAKLVKHCAETINAPLVDIINKFIKSSIFP